MGCSKPKTTPKSQESRLKLGQIETSNWRAEIDPFTRADAPRALLDLLTSVVPYLALSVAMYLSLDISYLLTLALAIPAAGFLVRTFIVFHDCGHGSFMPSARANRWIGRFTALLVFAAYSKWRHEHAVHHATAGDLDRRGVGDLPTMTVEEYLSKTPKARLGYRLFRNPAIMFTIGPIWSMMISPRIIDRSKRKRLQNSGILTNIVLVAWVVGWSFLIGPGAYFAVMFPAVLLAGAAGIWLFYVQHQFEDAYWESGEQWSYADAALRGSSYLKLPKILQFFSGNIGLHHVHHLSAAVPNYRLQAAHDSLAVFADIPVLSLADGLRATRLKLWDAERGRMIGWSELPREPGLRPAELGSAA